MIRRLWPLAVFCVLALLTIMGTMKILSQARMNVVLIRLPEVPLLSRRSEVLRKKINRADVQVRKMLPDIGTNEKFGQTVGRMGQLYQANQFYDQALSCYQLALKYDKKSAMWFYLSASIHQQRGETASMIGFLEQTLRLSSDYSPAVLKLADTYFKVGEMRKAKVYYERRLALTPGDPYAFLGLARIALDEGQWDDAEVQLQKAISSDSQFGDAHRLMAQVHEEHGRIEEMKKSLDRAADCTRFRPAPDPWIDDLEDLCYDPEQLLVLGSMALAALDIENAVKKHFARALEIDPENPKAHLAMGKAWFIAGEWSRAHYYLVRTIELDSTTDEAYFHLGLILRNENKLQDAEVMFLKALNYQPNNANVLNNLGVIRLEQGRYSDAIKSLIKALDIYPEHINALYNLGMSLWASGNSKAAVDQYRQVLEMKPNWRVAANSLAWILATDRDKDLRNGDDAVKWALVACRGEGLQNPEYLDTLAAAYAEVGAFDQAAKIAQECINLSKKQGYDSLAKEAQKRLQLYKDGIAFHN